MSREARVWRRLVFCIGLTLAIAPGSRADEPKPGDGQPEGWTDITPPPEPADRPLAVPGNAEPSLLDVPVVVPYRNHVPGVPVSGARTAPDVVLIRQKGWLATVLNGEADAPPAIGTFDPGGAVPEPAITALNIPDPPERPDAVSHEEIVVWGDRLERAREAVEQQLSDLGYRSTRDKDGRTLWRPVGLENRWKPRVWMDDDGWFTLETPAATFGGVQANMAQAPPGPPSISPAFDSVPSAPGVQATWRTSTRGQRFAAEARLVRQLAAVVEELRSAQGDRGLFVRLEGLPDELDRLWHDGDGPDGARYETVRERQSALLALWASRTRTRAGETVRRAIADYLLGEVEPEAPLPPDVVRAAERLCECALREARVEEAPAGEDR